MSVSATIDDLRPCWRLVSSRLLLSNLPIEYPHEARLINADLDGYLRSIAEQLNCGKYHADSAPIAEVPKGNGAIRPVLQLTIRDRIVYAYLGAFCLPLIKADLANGLRGIDFSYRFNEPTRQDQWFVPYYRPWRDFISSSVHLIDNGASVVVETDLSAFYENIDYKILFDELNRIAVPAAITALLRHCLLKWSPTTRRGLPQSHMTSHLLAKFYLSSVDQHLISYTTFVHRRFSDDVRFFCRSTVEAKLAIKAFISLVREKTLSIQTAKTRFLSAATAKQEFLGATPLIDSIRREYEAATRAELENVIFGAEYMSVAELMGEIREQGIPPGVFYRAYDELIRNGPFRKGIFHYLLSNLARIHDRYAVDDVVGRFVEQPQETEDILQYLASVNVLPDDDSQLLDFLELEDNIYAFQTSQFLKYFAVKGTHNRVRLRSLARRFAFAQDQPGYLRASARAILGMYGDTTDHQALIRNYAEVQNDLERSDIICNLIGMEAGSRNGFFATVAGTGMLVDRAIAATRGARERLSLPDPSSYYPGPSRI